MKNGILVVNGFLVTDKFTDFYSHIIDAFYKRGVSLVAVKNNEIAASTERDPLSGYNADFVLFFDKDIILARTLEKFGYPVFNSAKAIALCDDKRLTAMALNGIKIPKTIFAPFTFSNIGYSNTTFLHSVADELGFPLVMKEANGSFGKQVYLINSLEHLIKKFSEIKTYNVLFQELISTSYGRDVRIQVINNIPVGSVLRTAKDGEFLSNVTNGGKMSAYNPPAEFLYAAVNACKGLGLTFAGVDILFGKNDEPILCEVNSNAHFINLQNALNIDIADILAANILDLIN